MTPPSYVPDGARRLGCRGCRPFEQSRGLRVFCASCPVTLRQSGECPTAVIRWVDAREPVAP